MNSRLSRLFNRLRDSIQQCKSKGLRDCLRQCFKEGFWFPGFQRRLYSFHSWFSLSYRFKRWLAEGEEDAPPGASEFYQVILFVIAVVWVLTVNSPLHPILYRPFFRIVGGAAAGYFILEMFIFSLDWIFSAPLRLESHKRSLATMLLSLIEVALFFFVFLSLANCHELQHSLIVDSYENVIAFISLQLPPVRDTALCCFTAHFQRLVGAVILAIVIASLVGAVVREEKKEDKKKGESKMKVRIVFHDDDREPIVHEDVKRVTWTTKFKGFEEEISLTFATDVGGLYVSNEEGFPVEEPRISEIGGGAISEVTFDSEDLDREFGTEKNKTDD
jgi:hypothetical protein